MLTALLAFVAGTLFGVAAVFLWVRWHVGQHAKDDPAWLERLTEDDRHPSGLRDGD